MTLVMNSEEATAGYFSWQKLLKKARAVEPVMMMMMTYELIRSYRVYHQGNAKVWG
jgi:hypothetical protein